MRFLHTDIAPIKTYLASRPVNIRLLESELNPVVGGFLIFFGRTRRTALPPRQGSLEVVEELFGQTSGADMGGKIGEYVHINPPSSDRAVSLSAAIEHVEAFGSPAEFLLTGYHDGGLISVSRTRLPFQDGLSEANWWSLALWEPP